MELTSSQRDLVEQHMGLVGQVINNCVAIPQDGVLSLEDLQHIGRIGLCKAAYAYQVGNAHFGTYAYIVIRNEIYKNLSKQWRRTKNEDLWSEEAEGSYLDHCSELDILLAILRTEQESMPQSSAKGVDALILLAEGYSCKEIAAIYGCTTNLVTAWMSNARKALKTSPALKRFYADSKG